MIFQWKHILGSLRWKHRVATWAHNHLRSKNGLEWDNNALKGLPFSAFIVLVTTSYFPEMFHLARCSNNHRVTHGRMMCAGNLKSEEPCVFWRFVRCCQKHLIRITCHPIYKKTHANVGLHSMRLCMYRFKSLENTTKNIRLHKKPIDPTWRGKV